MLRRSRKEIITSALQTRIERLEKVLEMLKEAEENGNRHKYHDRITQELQAHVKECRDELQEIQNSENGVYTIILDEDTTQEELNEK